jgi:hypothetical protein
MDVRFVPRALMCGDLKQLLLCSGQEHRGQLISLLFEVYSIDLKTFLLGTPPNNQSGRDP